jgi:Flp pilus assembly protein TadG
MRHQTTISDERGATAIIVVLVATALLGMLALTLDVGRLLVLRRSLVRASDAAALAAALSCANPSKITSDPSSDANNYAQMNVAGASTAAGYPKYAGACKGSAPAGTVTAKYHLARDLLFARIWGASTVSVSATAIAKWGAAGAADNSTPIMLDASRLREPCHIPDTAIGTRCVLWYDSDLASSQWGLMNLDQWNVPSGAHCSSAGTNDRRNWISNGYPSLLAMADPGPTYVCADSGAGDPQWTKSLADQAGKVKLFPVSDQSRQIVVSGKVDKYAVVGFAALQIDEVLKGTDPGVADTTSTATTTGTCTGVHDFVPNEVLNLDSFGLSQVPPCYSSAPDSIPQSKLVLKNGTTTYNGCGPTGGSRCDYRYNAATHVLTWVRAAPGIRGVTVRFNWSKTTATTTGGKCGAAPDATPSNAFCLITEWRGYQTTPGDVGNGQNFGAESVSLSG